MDEQQVEPLVFTSEWIETLRTRYEGKPAYLQPFLYRLATRPEFRPRREIIEHWVRLIPPAKRRHKVIRDLQTDGHHQTFNELVVGDCLRQLGHSVEYEPCINGTPDWLVIPRDGSRHLITEVVTSEQSKDQKSRTMALRRLQLRLEGIPEGVNLSIGRMPEKDPRLLDDRLHRQFADRLKRWLSTGPTIGDSVVISGLTVELDGRNSIGKLLWLPTSGFWVDPAPVREAINRKVDDYQESALSMPLIVFVVPEVESGRGPEELVAALFGSLQGVSGVGDESGAVSMRRGDRGLFQNHPALAGAGIVIRNGETSYHTFIANPNCEHPVDQDLFVDPSCPSLVYPPPPPG